VLAQKRGWQFRSEAVVDPSQRKTKLEATTLFWREDRPKLPGKREVFSPFFSPGIGSGGNVGQA